MASPPLVAVVDTSPGPGGAVTSVLALEESVRARGMRTVVIARVPSAVRAMAPNLEVIDLGADDLSAVHGRAYVAREAERARKLLRLCRKLRPSVLLANNTPPANLAAYVTAPLLGVPLAQYVRGPFHCSRLASACLARASRIFTVGHGAARCVATSNVEFSRVQEGLREHAWPTPRRADAHHWLWCSALVGWKGLPLALEAYRRAALQESLPPLEVCFARTDGKHPDTVPLPSTIPPGVILHELPPDLDGIRARCQVYLHTALAPEPFGRSILEAMAAGLCPLVPDHGESAPLVDPGRTGLEYRACDPDALAVRLVELARRPEHARLLGEAASEAARSYRAATIFGPVADQLLQLAHPRGARSGLRDAPKLHAPANLEDPWFSLNPRLPWRSNPKRRVSS